MATPEGHLLFLSHAGVDTDAARALAERIEQSAAARERGLRVWLDKRDLVAGHGWRAQIEGAIERDSTAFAVLVGARGIVNWVEIETDAGLARAVRESGYPFIPILSERCGRGPEDALPPFVRRYEAVHDVENNPAEFAKLLAAAVRESVVHPLEIDEPFIGLRSFEPADAHVFFGREDETEELLERLRRHRMVIVVGDSGCGKSSLVKAGLLPRFRGGALGDPRVDPRGGGPWHVVETRPQREPFEALADDLARAARACGVPAADVETLRAAVRSRDPDRVRDALVDGAPPGAQTLLVVDQFEDLWTQSDEAARIAYARALARLTDPERPSPIQVVLTMRRDYSNLCRMPEVPEFSRRLEQSRGAVQRGPRYVLHRMHDAGVGRAVSEPLKLAGASANPALAHQVRREVGDEPGDLTLVQVALAESWQRRSEHGGDLLAAYVSIGGVAGALASLAEELFSEGLDEGEQRQAETIFLRLVRLGEPTGTTRRVAARDEFGGDAWRLVQKFATREFRRLIAVHGEAGAETAELCHEALVAQWPRYQRWLQAAAPDKRIHDRLIPAAARWEQAARADDCLLTGRDLDDGLLLSKTRSVWLSPSETELIAASSARRRHEQREATRHQTRVKRAAGVFLCLALLAGSAAWRAWRSERAARVAEQRARDAASQTYLREALAQLEHARADTALAYLAAGLRRGVETSALRVVVIDVLDHHAWPLSSTVLRHEAAVNSSAFSPDGLSVVTASDDGSARVWDARTGRPLTGPLRHDGPVRSAVFRPDGRMIASSSDDGSVRIWDTATGALAATFGHRGPVWAVAFSPDGSRVVSASDDRSARVWDARTGAPLGAPLRHDATVWSAVFSPDGRCVVTASDDRSARVWDAHTGAPLGAPMRHAEAVRSAVFAPDGRRVLTASEDGSARLWDARTGRALAAPWRHAGPLASAVFAPDGARVVSASSDGSARVWDTRTSEPVGAALEHAGPVSSAAFSPDGLRVLTASRDGLAHIWDARTGRALTEPFRHPGALAQAAFDPDGLRIVSASDDHAAYLWQVRTARPLTQPLRHARALVSAVFSRDGQHVFTITDDGSAQDWDAHSGRPLVTAWSGDERERSTAVSLDGRLVLTIARDRSACIRDAHTGRRLTPPLQHPGKVNAAAFSADAERIVTASDDLSALVWDARTGRALTPPLPHDGPVSDASFSPDGRRVITTSRVRHDPVRRRAPARPSRAAWQPSRSRSALIFNPEPLSTVSTEFDRRVQIWDALTGAPVVQPLEHAGLVWSVAFSPDGAHVVTTSAEGSARIWDARTGEPVTDPLEHAGTVWSAAFSPDGRRVVTASSDRSARIWDARSGKPLTDPLEHAGTVWSATFSPDGQRVVTTTDENAALVWDIPVAGESDAAVLADLAEAVAGLRVGEQGALVTAHGSAATLERLRGHSETAPPGRPTALSFMRWFFADPWERTISPFSAVTVPEYIQQRLAEGDPEVRAELQRDFAGHPLLRR